MKKETIDDKILKHLLAGNRINQWNCIELFRYTRLSATIFNLKARGYQINDEWKKGQNQKKYKDYWLEAKRDNEDCVIVDVKLEKDEPQQTGLDLGVVTKKKDYEWPD